jgi:hypothetical protein
MMKRIGKYIFAAALMTTYAHAAEVQGYLNTGVWYLKNNAASNPNFVLSDGYGQNYVQGNFALLNANLTMDVIKLSDPSSNVQTSLHLKARGLYDLLDRTYSLAPDDKYRYQLDETNVQFTMGGTNLWIGRHTVYEAGGIGVDGVTALFDTSEHFGIGLFGGLGNDPRTLTGYIGPAYRTTPFNADFYTGGVFTKYHNETFQMDTGVNTLLFKKKVDRSNLYTQLLWSATPSWMFSVLLDAGFMGQKGLQRGMLGITTKITPSLTNRLYISQFRSLFFKESNVSAIPVPGDLNPTFIVGTDVDTSEYYSARDEVQIKFDRNYIFTGLEFARRTYDDQNRVKYTLGYFDPEIFGSEFDFRIQTDVIKNYVSFNSSIDVMIGRDFANEKFRAEGGGTFYANERDLFENGVFVNSKGQIEKETTGRVNLIFNATHALSLFANYSFYKEVDVFNANQSVNTHEIYFSTNVRF